MALCINNTPAANPDKSKIKIIIRAIKGPKITRQKERMIEFFNENLNRVKAMPKDIRTKKIVA